MSSVESHTTPKQWALEFITALPDDCTITEIQHHLQVRGAVEQALASPRETDVSHDDAMKRARQCLDSVGQANR